MVLELTQGRSERYEKQKSLLLLSGNWATVRQLSSRQSSRLTDRAIQAPIAYEESF
jgi:hypothetical protein